MRLFLLVLLMVRPFGFLTLAMLFHGSAAESALALAEIPRGHGWKGDGTVVRTEGVPPSAPPVGSSLHVKLSTPPSSTVLSLPYPHHNTDCSSISCNDPLTPAPSGSPCGCVLPINVQLQLNVALDTFFPLVSELEREIAASTSLNISQVKTIGAEVANQQPDKTNVEVYLLPIGKGGSIKQRSCQYI